MNNNTQLRKVMRSAYFRRNNQQLPGPTRSAKLSGNGFMHPSLPRGYGYGDRWKEMQGTQEMMARKSRNKQDTDYFKIKKQNLNAQPMTKKISSNRQSKKSYAMRNSLKDCERSSKFVTDDILRSFGVLASDYSVSVIVNNSTTLSIPSFLSY
ncbi:unnamed protein product [Cercopithifilaria johnstoni]|uniref:Uncharacterized protein n=1 Tax=Cercopithifilaria johnstoni TaxID=2874296 RepID=A0A8J2M5I2_9BILA|nr:unnamed protein product [Cercopithifilaria johnstoni]